MCLQINVDHGGGARSLPQVIAEIWGVGVFAAFGIACHQMPTSSTPRSGVSAPQLRLGEVSDQSSPAPTLVFPAHGFRGFKTWLYDLRWGLYTHMLCMLILAQLLLEVSACVQCGTRMHYASAVGSGISSVQYDRASFGRTFTRVCRWVHRMNCGLVTWSHAQSCLFCAHYWNGWPQAT